MFAINKILKIIGILLITFMVCYFIYFIYVFFITGHMPSRQAYKQYMWIFKDSIKKDLDSNYHFSWVKKRDIYNNFNYRGKFNIMVWEFKDQTNPEFVLLQNADLYNVRFRSGVVLNDEGALEINIKPVYAFNDTIKIFLDEYSTIESEVKGSNFSGFFGHINNMSLSNEKDEHQIIFDYTGGKTLTLFLVYKRYGSFYLIMINSINPAMQFDESILKIMNFE
jgi:hypothetical protein